MQVDTVAHIIHVINIEKGQSLMDRPVYEEVQTYDESDRPSTFTPQITPVEFVETLKQSLPQTLIAVTYEDVNGNRITFPDNVEPSDPQPIYRQVDPNTGADTIVPTTGDTLNPEGIPNRQITPIGNDTFLFDDGETIREVWPVEE